MTRVFLRSGKRELLCADARGPADTSGSATAVSRLPAVVLVWRVCQLFRSCRGTRLLFPQRGNRQHVDHLLEIDESPGEQSQCWRDERRSVCRFS
jgi:hypothetical protein